jgi:hypothetical protein
MTSTKIFRAYAGLLAALDLMIEQVSDPVLCEASAPLISKWSVKDHLEHLSVANGSTVKWLERARDRDPELDTDGRPSMVGRVVLLFGAFPRGRGKAPERTRPQGTSATELADRLRKTRERVEGLEGSLAQLQASRATRHHFAFGGLNATQWLQFAVLHTEHHQKIIRELSGPDTGAL